MDALGHRSEAAKQAELDAARNAELAAKQRAEHHAKMRAIREAERAAELASIPIEILVEQERSRYRYV